MGNKFWVTFFANLAVRIINVKSQDEEAEDVDKSNKKRQEECLQEHIFLLKALLQVRALL